MIPNDQQGMSPKRTTVLEGETNGPSYGTATTQQEAQQHDAALSSEPVMNGARIGSIQDPSGEDQATVPRPSRTPPMPTAAEFLSASDSMTRDDHGTSLPTGVPELSAVDVGPSQGGVRMQVGGFEFSPPEALPSETQQQAPSNQVMWFARIGEFVQRRVAQAGSSDSFAKEQILAEVQKQVRAEMKVHLDERQALAHENQQLKALMSRVEIYLNPMEAFLMILLTGVEEFQVDYDDRLLSQQEMKVVIHDAVEMMLGTLVELEGTSKDLQEDSHHIHRNRRRQQVATQVVKPGLADLPRLPELGPNSAIDIGDWLHGLQNHMGDLSNNSGQWWSEIMSCLTKYYEAYLAASNVGKLTIKAEDFESDLLRDAKWARVDKRASSMILASVPEAVKVELLSTRLVGSLAMLSRVVVLYRPDAVTELRKWARWMARATDIGIQCPDASVLVRGLDTVVKKVLPEHADIAFRVSMLRYNLEVDTRPTVKGARDLQQALMSELEQVAFRGRAGNTSTPNVKAATVTTSSTTTAQKADGAEGGSPTGQLKAKAKPSCRFFLTDKGCSKGSACTFSHAFTRKEKMGRCWSCGSNQHQQSECPAKTGGGASPSAKAASKAPPAIKAFTEVPSTAGTPAAAAGASSTSSASTAAPDTSQQASESELKVLLQEASAMLKEIRQLKMLAYSTTDVENRAVGSGCDPRTGRTGLLDSGASHPFREATETELDDAARVRVQLADGKEVVLAQNSSGTLLTRKSGGDSSGPIVPLGALVQDLGCQISWTRRGGLTIRHPEHGLIRPTVFGRCPVVAEHQALDFIYEIECEKLRRSHGRDTLRTSFELEAVELNFELWFQRAHHFHRSEMDRSLAAEHVNLDDKSGWAYLRALPGSRQRRKRMMSSPWVLHLYAGPGKGVDPAFRELDDGRVLVQVDINRSKAEDMGMVAGVYRALLWAAATGRVDGIIGSPPARVDLVQKMMWLMMVAKAARSHHGGHPVFAMIEGKKLMDVVRIGGVHKWESVTASWDMFTEVMCLEEVCENIATNLTFGQEIPQATSDGAAWTMEFKEAVSEAIRHWDDEMGEKVGKFLETFTDKELAMWRTHVRNNHVPYNKRCRTCVTTSGTGRAHRRVRHPSSHCLSLDIAGPFRHKAADPNHKDYRYLLVGAYTMPRLPAEEPKPEEPHGLPAEEPKPEEPHVLPAEEPKRKEPHVLPAEEPKPEEPHVLPAEEPKPEEPHVLPVEEPKPEEPHVLPPGEEALGHDHFTPLELGGHEVPDDFGYGVGNVFPEDALGDPMEEVTERRGARKLPEEECRGLSEEEFKRLFNEVGYAMDFQTVYVVQPLRTRTAGEVTAAVQSVVLRLKAEGLYISRIHADRARELRVESIKRWALERGIFCTYTEGQAPQANGKAEAGVKWVKSSVKRLLMCSDLPKEAWAVAANYAVQNRMEQLLRQSTSMLPFGTRVHVRSKVYGTGGKYDLDSRWKAGTYVGPSLEVRGGHLIRFEDGSYMTSTHLRPHLVETDKIVDLDEYEVMLPMPTRRLKGKVGATDLDQNSEHEVLHLKYDPEHPAEQYAMRLLEEEILTADQLENLARMLPSTAPTPKRFGPQRDTQKVWTAGAFVHGGIVGVKNATGVFPASTRALIKYVKQLEPEHKFNAVAITTDIEAKQHVDAHNVGKNLVASLSYFKGGALEVEYPEGARLLPLDGDHTHQLFDPKFKHSTKPWFGGSRIVLVAYSVRDSGKLKEDQIKYLQGHGFEWVPHLSKPIVSEDDKPVVKMIRVGLLDATGDDKVPAQPRDPPEHEGDPGVGCGDDVSGQHRDPPEHEGDPVKGLRGGDHMTNLVHDVELAIGDLEDRAGRLRDLLEEEEILCEEYRRLGQATRENLNDTRNQVSEFLEQMYEELLGLERLRTMTCLRSVRVSQGANEGDDVDYEALLDSLEEDLKVVHTVPVGQVKRALERWTAAIRKEVEALFASGTLRRVTIEEAKEMESKGLVTFAPAKCVFTLKPPQVPGSRARRKCRMVICGNHVQGNADFGDLYAAGSSTDALRLTLIISAVMKWVGAISDITGAFLLASWPAHLPKYGVYPPRIIRDANVAGLEAWIVERPLYGLRESPRIWCDYRNQRLLMARIPVGDLMLILKPTVSEPELWIILDEVTGIMYGLMVLYVDDIAYFSTEPIVLAVHAYVVKEWPASDLEWITEANSVRYLGVEIGREVRTNSGGEAFRVYTIGQTAYIQDLLRSYNMMDVTPTALPVPKEWIEAAENDDEAEADYDEQTLRQAQRVVGEMLWLGTRTRPDLMFVVSHAASLVAKRPSYVVRLGNRLLAYLAGTAELKMTMGPVGAMTEAELIAYTDASYAPFGRRSFGAAVVTFAGSPVAWKSGRQSFITLSVMEAELYAATQGCTLLNSVYALLAEVYPTQVKRILAVDNTSAAAMLAGGHGSQRTRHLKIRANYVREAVEEGNFEIRHTPGSEQLADLSTKMQSKLRLHQLLQLWGFVGFASNVVQAMKLKLLSVLMVLAQCVCPARGHRDEAKEPLPATTWEELLVMMFAISIVAVCFWELLRCGYRRALRWHKKCRKAQRLAQAGQLASAAARREIDAVMTNDTTATPRLRRRTTMSSRPTPRTPSPMRTPSMPTTPQVPTARSPMSTAGNTTPATRPRSVTPPTQRRISTPPTGAQAATERTRVCRDTLKLMTCEDLRSALRLEGQPVSGIKEDLCERLSPSLESSDVTDKQLRYVLYLWRHKDLSYRCKLRWEDINNKYRVSAWIARWKNA
ncbi:RE1 [Symbiodinium sp. CCMP2592]|nr:RE1 [Symbiodinium sp. CCMP2592]